MRPAWYGIAALALVLMATAHRETRAVEMRLGDMRLSADTRNAFTLKLRETVLLREGSGQVRPDWKSPPDSRCSLREQKVRLTERTTTLRNSADHRFPVKHDRPVAAPTVGKDDV